MEMPVDGTDQELARLRADYKGYQIWRATRHDGLLGEWVATLHDPRAGIYPTIVRNSAEELRKALDIERVRAADKTMPEPNEPVQW